MHLIKWKELCRPIEDGGLGIREFDSNNKVLPAKACWNYLNKPDLLCAKILKAKYCTNKDIWEASSRGRN